MVKKKSRPHLTEMHHTLCVDTGSEEFKTYERETMNYFFAPEPIPTFREMVMEARKRGDGLWAGHIFHFGRRAAILQRILHNSQLGIHGIGVIGELNIRMAHHPAHIDKVVRPAIPMVHWFDQ